VGRASGLGKFDIFWKIQLPAALPTLYWHTPWSDICLFNTIGCGDDGDELWQWIRVLYYGNTNGRYDSPDVAAIVTLAILTISINLALLQIEKDLTKWKNGF
jgi:ABC-type nitrate/sulfonate/bicarbonate transport system permease component